MPVFDGFAATELMRKQGITIPITALTANAIKGDDERCPASGMNDYLTKPFKLENLQAVLQKWLA